MSILDRIIEWANKEKTIRTIILEGSHAAGIADRFSDYDLVLFCTSFDPYIKDEKWLSCIGNVWVCVHEKLERGNKMFPTRLVIFEGGAKVDFSFYTMDVLHGLVSAKSLPDAYNRGYSTLIDKDSLAASMAKPTSTESPAVPPSEAEFLRVVNEFWFEVYHVAKYLKREDLWSVKGRSHSIYDNFLLKMIEWHEEAIRNLASRMPPLGKRMQSWVSAETWCDLQRIFAHFDRHDSCLCLKHTAELFRRLAVDVSKRLGFAYPQDVDRNISNFVTTILSSD